MSALMHFLVGRESERIEDLVPSLLCHAGLHLLTSTWFSPFNTFLDGALTSPL